MTSESKSETSESEAECRRTPKKKAPAPLKPKRARRKSIEVIELEGEDDEEEAEVGPVDGADNGDEEDSDGLQEIHHATVPDARKTKKRSADDVLTVFLDRCMVKFCETNGNIKTVKGRWCNICK
ncbi:hypothetical protein AZE42_13995 [Rhizopogon vesiculosus]|uniref:Uncharacterized protein n=1 Tax=Rhizopogon vesiculosus TaxID=180088 RepID=A0A1J8PGD0_9AGAM|nr:hypothetical protein AZE42_13995 [Rhizopogon vesiculosus]